MKLNAVIFCLILLSCNQHANNNLQTKIDSLQSVIDKSYKPALGEFMSNIQVHHAKLWFAGQNRNWELADFEITEIKEAMQGIKNYSVSELVLYGASISFVVMISSLRMCLISGK